MNLAEPSGSSPELKPPGSMRIWDSRMEAARAVRDSSTASGVRLRKTRISESAPAWLKTAAVSYSQLVPGKTGMRTLGLVFKRAGAFFGVSRVTGEVVISSDFEFWREVVW